ncbi:MAG: tRNA 2-thiocytidine(32) synthetase TtcA [Deltaproteobacteria bacterium]|nr:tRNA 2-thiocytidine(32) synthetase TtcA [Deltaproteobacteria bacterium]
MDHLRLRTLAEPLWQAGEHFPRAFDEPVIDHLDRELLDTEAVREDPHEAAETFGRYEHERPELAAVLLRALRECSDSVQRDERLADARLAVEHERGIRGQIDRALLIRIQHDHGIARARGGGRGLRARTGLLAVGAEGTILSDQRVDLAAANGQPSLEHAPCRGARVAGLDLVALSRCVPEEHRGQRRGPPVEHRYLGIERGPWPEDEPALPALGLDGEVTLRCGGLSDELGDVRKRHGGLTYPICYRRRTVTDLVRRLEARLYRDVKDTSERYKLLAPGDRIMIAMSGGKDSYTLFHLLGKLVPRLPFGVELIAVHLDQAQPNYDGSGLRAFLEASGQRFEILREDTYSVVTSHLPDTATYCSLCSRLRRGILYTAAERLGCNKIALGHHRDDSLETFLLNLFYSGKLQAMPASYRTDDGRFEVIRPLIECAESDIAEYASHLAFPIIPCNLCGSQEGLKRDAMTELLAKLEQDNPHVRAVMANALRNIRPTHLLDRDVARAWAERAPDIRPTTVTEPRKQHAAAAPVFSGGKLRLPVVDS